MRRYRRRHLAGTDVRAATPRPRSSGLLRVILSTTRPVDQLAGGHRTRVIPALSDDAIQRRQDLVGHFVLKAFGDDAQPEHVELGIHRCALVSMRRRPASARCDAPETRAHRLALTGTSAHRRHWPRAGFVGSRFSQGTQLARTGRHPARLRTDRTAAVIIARLAVMQNLRRGHYETGSRLPGRHGVHQTRRSHLIPALDPTLRSRGNPAFEQRNMHVSNGVVIASHLTPHSRDRVPVISKTCAGSPITLVRVRLLPR